MKQMNLGNIFILGDSYSTFEGYIPEGYVFYYEKSAPAYVTRTKVKEADEGDVTDVSHTWWYNFCNENGNLIRNCSWSGTTICNTGYNGSDNSEISFVARLEKLIQKGFFEENPIDTFFLFGGTNDSWSDAPVGDLKYSQWTKDDLYKVLPAFCYLLDSLNCKLPETKVYCIINSELKSEITDNYKTACKKYGVEFIELSDIDKICGHPTKKGMLQIKEQISGFIAAHH